MNKKVRILLGLFLVLLAIVAAAQFWPRPQAPELRLAGWGPGRQTERVDEDKLIDRIDLAIGPQAAVLTRSDEGWRLEPPKGVLADQTKVQQILEGLREDVVSQLGSLSTGDEAAFGLDPGHRVRVTLKRSGAIVTDLEIGAVRKPEVGGGPGDTFVRVPGEQRAWRILDQDLRRAFDDGVSGLRDRRVLTIETHRIVAITLTHPLADDPLDRRIVLQSEALVSPTDTTGQDHPQAPAKGRIWHIAFPPGYEAGDVDRLTTSLGALWAREWVDEVPEGVDLGANAFAIEATMEDGTNRMIRVSEVLDGDAWAQVQGVPGVAKLTPHSAESLCKRLGDLRDKSLIGWTSDRIAAVELFDGDRHWHFARRGNGYMSVFPADLSLDRAAVDTLLADIARMRADRIVPAAETTEEQTGLATPRARLVVTSIDGRRRTLHVGRSEEAKTWVRMDGTTEVATVAPWMVDRVRKDSTAFRNRTIFSFGATDIARIRIVHPDETLTLVANPDTGDDAATPFLIDGATKPPDPEIVIGLVSTLAGLAVNDFPEDAPRRLERPDLRVVVTLRDGSQHEIRIAGQDGNGNPYGTAPTAPGFGASVFTLSPQQASKIRVRKADLLP